MHTHLRLAGALLLSITALQAQVTVTLKRSPAHSSEVEIRNTSAVNLAAFALRIDPVADAGRDVRPFLVFIDSLVETDGPGRPPQRGAVPFPPDQSYFVPVPISFRQGRMVDLYAPPILTAAIFADGATSGDAALLRQLLSRRSSMLQAVELARDLLSEAGNRNLPRSHLVKQFQALADSGNHWYLPPEQKVGRALYQSIAEELINLPQPQLGSPFPPTAFVEKRIADLKRQRTALLESQPVLAIQ